MTEFVAAGAGFLLAVLWFDLMFDVQILGRRATSGERDDGALRSITAYYRRVTTGARPMNLLIGVVMIATLVAIGAQIAAGGDPRWVGWASLALAGGAIAVALFHTIPTARRLGRRTDDLTAQRRLARSIGRAHLLCIALIALLLVVQLAFG